MSGTEQRGVCAGGKKPTARSIKQDFETFFESFKIRTAWRKDFFDTLGREAEGFPPNCLKKIRLKCLMIEDYKIFSKFSVFLLRTVDNERKTDIIDTK